MTAQPKNPNRKTLPSGNQGSLSCPGGRYEYRKEQRREEAMARQVERNQLSAAEQLAILDMRLGKDQGAKKERTRLKKEIPNV